MIINSISLGYVRPDYFQIIDHMLLNILKLQNHLFC